MPTIPPVIANRPSYGTKGNAPISRMVSSFDETVETLGLSTSSPFVAEGFRDPMVCIAASGCWCPHFRAGQSLCPTPPLISLEPPNLTRRYVHEDKEARNIRDSLIKG